MVGELPGNTPTALSRTAELLRLLAEDPAAAADRMDVMADELRAAASRIRAGLSPRCAGGASERVRMRVVGPDGQTKQQTDTERRLNEGGNGHAS